MTECQVCAAARGDPYTLTLERETELEMTLCDPCHREYESVGWIEIVSD